MKFLMIDVESVGLHGEGFAVGAVEVDTDKMETGESHYFSASPNLGGVDPATINWLEKNVFPSLAPNSVNVKAVLRAFWSLWLEKREQGFKLIGDTIWPVEANFISACIEECVLAQYRMEQSPYPLYDLASMLSVRGVDPLGEFDRLPNELPKHNALNDARQSARLLLEGAAASLKIFSVKATSASKPTGADGLCLCSSIQDAINIVTESDDNVVIHEMKYLGDTKFAIR